MDNDFLDQLSKCQCPSGAFPSFALADGQKIRDENCFTTAQIVWSLLRRGGPGDQETRSRDILERALDFVESCESKTISGAYGFYPPDSENTRFTGELPPDADDTALAWIVLSEAGRRKRSDGRKLLKPLLENLRALAPARGDPPWAGTGLYRTWFGTETPSNPVDICVNINILACMEMLGFEEDPHLTLAFAGIKRAFNILELSASSLRSLAPFYASPAEVEIALRRAVEVGVSELEPVYRLVRNQGHEAADRQAGRPDDRPLYCNAHGRPRWYSPALQLVRRHGDATFPSRNFTTNLIETDGVRP